MTNSGPQLWVNGALEMSPNISYQPLSTARFASLTLPLYMNGNSFKLVNSSPRAKNAPSYDTNLLIDHPLTPFTC